MMAALMRDTLLWSAVVMPCLNEVSYLRSTCESLGFGTGSTPPVLCSLVLVDNGSTDGTLDVCHQLRDEVGPSITIAQEPIRGHVPARHRGNLVAAQLAKSAGVPDTAALIIQVDADTQYSPGYVDSIRESFQSSPNAGIMGQAATRFPPELLARYPGLFMAIQEVDDSVEDRFGLPVCDVVVDDKACCYMLYDYFRWSGHRREYFDDGSEILAETTRLMIAARSTGTKLRNIDNASAVHSQRRLFESPVQMLSTAGFPYSAPKQFPGGGMTLDDIERRVTERDIILREIRSARSAHLVALLALLPAHVEHAITGAPPNDKFLSRLLTVLPKRSVGDAFDAPGCFVADVLNLVWSDQPTLVQWK
jgi:hypothetical protein